MLIKEDRIVVIEKVLIVCEIFFDFIIEFKVFKSIFIFLFCCMIGVKLVWGKLLKMLNS